MMHVENEFLKLSIRIRALGLARLHYIIVMTFVTIIFVHWLSLFLWGFFPCFLWLPTFSDPYAKWIIDCYEIKLDENTNGQTRTGSSYLAYPFLDIGPRGKTSLLAQLANAGCLFSRS